IELGVDEKLALKAIYLVTMVQGSDIQQTRIRTGDIGDTAEELILKKKQQPLYHEDLTIERVYDNLKRISLAGGRSSQDLKIKLIAELLHDASPAESKYIVRTVCQKMRIGSADMTMIDSLASLATRGMEEIAVEAASFEINDLEDHINRLKKHSVISLNYIIDKLSASLKNMKNKENARDILVKIKELKVEIRTNREEIVRAYNIHPDLGLLTGIIISEGMGGIKKIEIEPGVPLRAMLGERLRTMDDILEKLGGKAALEYKYDGLRIQAHILGTGQVKLFSRQMEDITDQFPDVVANLLKGIKTGSVILDCECIPIDGSTGAMLPFQVISKRRGRKHDLADTIKEIPVDLVVFDCLYAEGSSYLDVPYLERRKRIKELFTRIDDELATDRGISISKMGIFENSVDAYSFFNQALDEGAEGIMAKSIMGGSNYQAGSRGWQWIKFKRDYRSEINDTLDLVIIGAFHGSGKRGGAYGAFLMAVFDPENSRYQTICKLGSGFNDEQLSMLPKKLEGSTVKKEAMRSIVDCNVEPDVFFEPSVVLEIMGAEITFSPIHTCAWGLLMDDHGLAVRFPRFTGKFRDDKSSEQATTVGEIISMYKTQKKTI
ncbi:MAG: ATP-dependent DNA ligase, partial [Candidatus Thermoplasmatota archaeon]|nr:ATP-dependent DNA ligase [Candidatus Thermoplasmatota archaeon]